MFQVRVSRFKMSCYEHTVNLIQGNGYASAGGQKVIKRKVSRSTKLILSLEAWPKAHVNHGTDTEAVRTGSEHSHCEESWI